MYTKLLNFTLCSCLVITPVSISLAGINDELSGFFNAMGAQSNISSGGAFHGQSQNVTTGGSLYLRLPQQNYSLANVELPALKAGCGGIDWFAGSFSHINKEAFVSMIRNAGNAALGYAFELAVDAVDPLIGGVLKSMRRTLEMVNNANIASCEAGQALVNGIVGKTNLSAQQGCSSLGAYLNIFNDRREGIGECSDPIKRGDVARSVAGNTTAKKIAPLNLISGNLMARILADAYSWMSQDERRLLISLTGTMLINNANPDRPVIQMVPPSLISERDIVAGVIGSGTGSDYVKLMLLNCTDPDVPTCPPPSLTSIRSLRAMVDRRLTEYAGIMQTPDRLWTSSKKAEMVNFVNITAVPVLKVLKMDFARNTDLRVAYTDLIASQYAIYFLQTMVQKAAAALGNYQSKSADEMDQVVLIRERLIALREILIRNEADNEAKAIARTNVQLQLAKFEEVLRGNDADLASRLQTSHFLSGLHPS